MDSRDKNKHCIHSDDGTVDNPTVNEDRCLCRLFLVVLLAIATAPYRRTFKLYTWRPLKEMRAARGDRTVLIPLVRQWKLEKYEELRSVQVSVSFSDTGLNDY